MPTETPDGTEVLDRPEVAGKRLPGTAQLGVQHGHLQRGLGHPVPDDRREQRIDQLRGDVPAGRRLGKQPRNQEAAQHLCRSVGVFRAVQRQLHGDAFTPALHVDRVSSCAAPPSGTVPTTRIRTAIRSDLDPERGLERAHQRHPDGAQFDPGDLHRSAPSRLRRLVRQVAVRPHSSTYHPARGETTDLPGLCRPSAGPAPPAAPAARPVPAPGRSGASASMSSGMPISTGLGIGPRRTDRRPVRRPGRPTAAPDGRHRDGIWRPPAVRRHWPGSRRDPSRPAPGRSAGRGSGRRSSIRRSRRNRSPPVRPARVRLK